MARYCPAASPDKGGRACGAKAGSSHPGFGSSSTHWRVPQMKIRWMAVVYCLAVSPASAQAPAAPPSPLPVRQVTLFTSGVSYTERAGEVDGNADVPLVFRTPQINDILKS